MSKRATFAIWALESLPHPLPRARNGANFSSLTNFARGRSWCGNVTDFAASSANRAANDGFVALRYGAWFLRIMWIGSMSEMMTAAVEVDLNPGIDRTRRLLLR